MKEKKTQTRNRKGAKPIVDALFKMAKVSPNDTFQRKLARYTRTISKLDYGQIISVDELEDSDYEKFKNIMLHIVEQYDISNLEKWCNIKNPSDLYRIEEEGQIHFYEETRSFFMALHRRDHGEARKAYARMNGIPAPPSQLNRKARRMHKIYTYIKDELFKPELTNPKDREAKKTDFSDLNGVELCQKQEELQQQLRQSDDDLAQSEQDVVSYTATECRQESILTQLLELYADLLSRSHSDDTRQHYQTERRTYRNKLEALKAKKYHLLYSNPEMLHIKLNLLEGISETQFTEMDPTQEKQNRIYSRCRKEFDRRASELLDSIIEEVTQEVIKELEQEAEQQEKE